MAVYVDDMNVKWRGKLWCHLVADSLDELHAFADTINVPRTWFHRWASYPHYDLVVDLRAYAIELGAIPSGRRTVLAVAKNMKKIQTEQMELVFQYK